MTLVNAETGEIVADISADEAREITDRIKVGVEAVWHLIVEAYNRGAHRALGYSSWDDYCTREFGTSRLKLPREERQEVVASLRESGLSIRAIAAATGLGQGTVQREVAGVPNGTPADEWRCERCGGVDSEDHDDPEDCHCNCGLDPDCHAPVLDPQDVHDRMVARTKSAAPKKITGTDGKSYTAPPKQQSKPKRPPLSDTAQRAGWDFRKSVERLERICADDRFSANREQVASHIRGHLSYAVEVCQDLIARLDQQSQED